MTTDEQNLRDALQRLELTVNTLDSTVRTLKEAVDKSVSMAEFTNLRRDVDSLMSVKEWAFRIVVGAVIVALLALVISSNGGP